ncbi:succinate--CoA ligase subunit alpha [Paraburkholderia acidiphila]|uniref:Succinate--CoA ligase subunit alpha n=1 Tax=Paraburkholderia acidiphila TaxID=2571747 RepID=A0A7Z2J960_9BURK|nr:succinate--CoA ligase subunit alpha [Paraburkholderia acidiphila]QGZ56407.1 succinate--CoA ligase subunit alpha [Paraburkholderia acidiphila]
MSIIIDRTSAIVVHGAGSSMALHQSREMLEHGTNLIGIIDPDNISGHVLRGATLSLPNFKTAVESAAIDVALFFDPPDVVKYSVLAAIDAGIKTVVCLTEYVPVHDALTMRNAALDAGAMLIGPNSSGVLSPGVAKAGYFCDELCMPGNVGIVTKGGSIAYGILMEMKLQQLGVSTIVSVGPDRVKGADCAEILQHFEQDPATDVILLLGEVGGEDEENAARTIASAMRKPVVAHVAGKSLKVGQQIGHANAIVRKGTGGYESKVHALREAGAVVADEFKHIAPLLLEVLGRR